MRNWVNDRWHSAERIAGNQKAITGVKSLSLTILVSLIPPVFLSTDFLRF